MEIPIYARSNTPPFSIEIDGTFTEGYRLDPAKVGQLIKMPILIQTMN